MQITASPPSFSTPGPSAPDRRGPYTLHLDPRSSHQQIARLVRRFGRGPTLDVGAAQGFLGRTLQGSGLTIDAVEPNPAWTAAARPFYRTVVQSTIEAAPLPERAYAVVVCADILEHTVDPAAVLRRLRAAAESDALFIISVPNAVHIAARLLVLCGRFPQMDRGPFDRTHLHFYTRRTATELLREAGLEVIERRATPAPLGHIWPAAAGGGLVSAIMRAQGVGLRLAPTLFAYQWIMVARPA